MNERLKTLERVLKDVDRKLYEAKLILDEAINNLLDDDYGNSTVDGALAVQGHINDARLSCE